MRSVELFKKVVKRIQTKFHKLEIEYSQEINIQRKTYDTLIMYKRYNLLKQMFLISSSFPFPGF